MNDRFRGGLWVVCLAHPTTSSRRRRQQPPSPTSRGRAACEGAERVGVLAGVRHRSGQLPPGSACGQPPAGSRPAYVVQASVRPRLRQQRIPATYATDLLGAGILRCRRIPPDFAEVDTLGAKLDGAAGDASRSLVVAACSELADCAGCQIPPRRVRRSLRSYMPMALRLRALGALAPALAPSRCRGRSARGDPQAGSFGGAGGVLAVAHQRVTGRR